MRKTCSVIATIAITLTGATAANAIAPRPSVLSMQTLENVNGYRPAWGLDRINQRSNTLDDAYSYSSDGSGVTVYVVDSGIYAEHAEFGGRVRLGFNAVQDGRTAADCTGHGTHSAGIIGGTKFGVAKAVSLVSVRVLDCATRGSMTTLVAGLNWIIEDHVSGPAIVNISAGMVTSSTVNALVQSVIDDGIIVVSAAGNDARDACGYSPASAPNAITVGAIDRSFAKPTYSNYGACVDIFAPGSDIVAAHNAAGEFRSTSGTSNAAPFVAGVMATLLAQNPTYGPTELMSLATTGTIGKLDAASPNLLLYNNAPIGTPQDIVTTTSSTSTTTSTTSTTVAPTTTTTASTTTTSSTTTIPSTTTTAKATTTTIAKTTTTTAVKTTTTTVKVTSTTTKTVKTPIVVFIPVPAQCTKLVGSARTNCINTATKPAP